MLAVQLTAWESPATVREVPIPEPGPGELRLRVGGAGLCHSDLHLMHWPAGAMPYELPFTLGHEVAGAGRRARRWHRGARPRRRRARLRALGLRPLPGLQPRRRAPVRGPRRARPRRRARTRRRPRRLHDRPVTAADRADRRPRSGRRRPAGRRRPHALPRDPPRASRAAAGDERDRDRRRRPRPRGRPHPARAVARADRGRRPARGGARAGRPRGRRCDARRRWIDRARAPVAPPAAAVPRSSSTASASTRRSSWPPEPSRRAATSRSSVSAAGRSRCASAASRWRRR